jgi:sec-independent protein translocase protein TatB
MFGLGFGEIVIIAILALLVLGPDRLPDAAKTIGKTLRDLRKATDDIKGQLETEIYADDRKIVKPALVPPVAAVPGPAGPPPPATAENVPGLEAALAEPEPPAALVAATTTPPAPATPRAEPPVSAASPE